MSHNTVTWEEGAYCREMDLLAGSVRSDVAEVTDEHLQHALADPINGAWKK